MNKEYRPISLFAKHDFKEGNLASLILSKIFR